MRNKRNLSVLVCFCLLTAAAAAEETKIGMEFKQQFDAGWIDRQMSATAFDKGNDSVYSKTEIKGSAGFRFGNLSMTPWIRERLEMKLNTDTAANTSLAKTRWRNRLFLGIDNAYKIIDPLSILLNFEFLITSDLCSGRTGEGYLVSQIRFSPLLGLTGKAGGLYYTAKEYFHIYTKEYKSTLEDAEKIRTELEGIYNAGYTLKLEAFTITFDLCENLGFMFGTADSGDEQMYSILSFKTVFGLGSLSPYIGFISDFCYDLYAEDFKDNITGFRTGVDLKKDKVSFGFDYRIGKESVSGTIQSYISTCLKVAF